MEVLTAVAVTTLVVVLIEIMNKALKVAPASVTTLVVVLIEILNKIYSKKYGEVTTLVVVLIEIPSPLNTFVIYSSHHSRSGVD